MLTSAQTETIDSGIHSPAPHARMDAALQHVVPMADAQSALSDTPMTDEEREQAAYRAGCAMQAWYSQYQHTGEAKYLDMAHEAMGLMRKLLAGRSKEAVLRQEISKGLI